MKFWSKVPRQTAVPTEISPKEPDEKCLQLPTDSSTSIASPKSENEPTSPEKNLLS